MSFLFFVMRKCDLLYKKRKFRIQKSHKLKKNRVQKI
jgi:hypothetical protein